MSVQVAERKEGEIVKGGGSRRDWAQRIVAAWSASVAGFISVGRLLLDAKASLQHGEFVEMAESDLPFSLRRAECLMAIAADVRISHHAANLPPSWTTLYELSRLPDERFEKALESGEIHSGMERRDALILVRGERRRGKVRTEEVDWEDTPVPMATVAASILVWLFPYKVGEGFADQKVCETWIFEDRPTFSQVCGMAGLDPVAIRKRLAQYKGKGTSDLKQKLLKKDPALSIPFLKEAILGILSGYRTRNA